MLIPHLTGDSPESPLLWQNACNIGLLEFLVSINITDSGMRFETVPVNGTPVPYCLLPNSFKNRSSRSMASARLASEEA